jgi:hypothetical protein
MAVAFTEPIGTTIDSLFRPSTRFRDSHVYGLPEGWTEVDLLQDLWLEDVLATGITWEDFCLFLRNKVIVWMTPDVYIHSSYIAVRNAENLMVLALKADADPSHHIFVHRWMGTAAAAATATCDFLLRLLATCEKDDVSISGDDCLVTSPLRVSGAGLSRFFQESRSCLRRVTLNCLLLSEDQCLALTTMSRLDVELVMYRCSLSNGASCAFVECLPRKRQRPDPAGYVQN